MQCLIHQLGAQSHHQHTTLHLAEPSVTVHVPFPHHPAQLLVAQPIKSQHGRVPLQALERDQARARVHQQPEPIAELGHEALYLELLCHRGQKVLELDGSDVVSHWN